MSRQVRILLERLILYTSAALCQVLNCEPADLLHFRPNDHHQVTSHQPNSSEQLGDAGSVRRAACRRWDSRRTRLSLAPP